MTRDKQTGNIVYDNKFTIPRMIALSEAKLCIDCNTIFGVSERRLSTDKNMCPNCGSTVVKYVAKFLNRKE